MAQRVAGAAVEIVNSMANLFQEWQTQSLGAILAWRCRDFLGAHNFCSSLPSDPWSKEEDDAVRQPDAVPVCHRCFEPQVEPAWFCRNCGAAIGSYNNAIPFVYLFSMGEVWRSGVEPKARFTWLTVPGYIIVSLFEVPYLAPLYWVRLFFNWRRLSRQRGADPSLCDKDKSGGTAPANG